LKKNKQDLGQDLVVDKLKEEERRKKFIEQRKAHYNEAKFLYSLHTEPQESHKDINPAKKRKKILNLTHPQYVSIARLTKITIH